MIQTTKLQRLAIGLGCLHFIAGGLLAQNTRQIFVQELNNPRSQFAVRIAVDRKDHRYEDGEEIRMTVESGKAGYLYLFNLVGDKVVCIFPNNVQANNRIAPKEKIQVPASGDFAFRVGAPYGEEIIKALVTQEALSAVALEEVTKRRGTMVDEATLKAIVVEDLRGNKKQEWATHQVAIRTFMERPERPKPQRIGVFVGCGQYKDHRVPNILACGNDATLLCDTMTHRSKLDRAYRLVNQQATFSRVKSLFQQVANETRPGDEVVIYWSGHGARCSDQGGEEADGLDELYLLYDSNVANVHTTQQTCVSDDMLGNWILTLSGRKVLLILDTCHSGGSANNEKGFHVPFLEPLANDSLDGIANDLSRAKDIGQENVIVLASSRAREKSFIRTDGKLSVLAYELDQLLKKSQAMVTVQAAHRIVSKSVADYTRRRYSAAQNPVLIGDERLPFLLVP